MLSLHRGYGTILGHRDLSVCVCASPTAPNISDAAGTLPEVTLETPGLVACRLLLPWSSEPVPSTMLFSAMQLLGGT